MSSFVWHYYEDGEGCGFFPLDADNITDAIAEAKAQLVDEWQDIMVEEKIKSIWIGRPVEICASKYIIRADHFIEQAQESAYDEQGEWAESWLEKLPPEAITELDEALKTTWKNWLAKHSNKKFWELEDVKEYPL